MPSRCQIAGCLTGTRSLVRPLGAARRSASVIGLHRLRALEDPHITSMSSRSSSSADGKTVTRSRRVVSTARWLPRHDRSVIPELATFFVANVSTCYISHTELWSGRARDFAHWAPRLSRIITKELRDTFRDRTKRVAVFEREGELVGMAVIVDLGRYALLEDIVIKRAARGCGVGRSFVRWLLRELRAGGKHSVFLESGGRNTAAHRFFEKQGFRRVSIQMCRPLAA